jgi:hypothetical protein
MAISDFDQTLLLTSSFLALIDKARVGRIITDIAKSH